MTVCPWKESVLRTTQQTTLLCCGPTTVFHFYLPLLVARSLKKIKTLKILPTWQDKRAVGCAVAVECVTTRTVHTRHTRPGPTWPNLGVDDTRPCRLPLYPGLTFTWVCWRASGLRYYRLLILHLMILPPGERAGKAGTVGT